MSGWSAIFVVGVLVLAAVLGGLQLMRNRTWGSAPEALLKKADGTHPKPHMETNETSERPKAGPET